MFSQEDDLLFQSYFCFILLIELQRHLFLESDFFKDMSFGAPWIKTELAKLPLENQGSALIALYVMLVVPKELIWDKYPEDQDALSDFLRAHTQNTRTTYGTDQPRVNFLRHIRNAVSHARVAFRPHDVIIFRDRNPHTGEEFETELPLAHLGEFLHRLQEIHLRYIRELQSSH